ncbi:MAG: glycosyltransferase family 2 protein [Bacillales bacterium]|nr:glycosyltransferase family 2 protein [Bacillales bacterium]
MKTVSLIVPMYNEEEMIPLFFETLNKVINEIEGYQFEYVLVNDGSKDNTLSILKEYQKKQDNINLVSFSRNFGHEAAVAAGFAYAKGDVMIVMDADLQDPPEVMKDMLKKYEEGYLVVNGKRVDRQKDSFMKRNTAAAFYKVIKKLSGKIKVPENVGNYRLMDRRVVDEINKLPEKNRVFRVEVPFAGFKTTEVEFVRQERPKGKTHYNYKSMFHLAGDSICSSSIEPLRYPFVIGIGLMGINAFLFIVNFIFHMCHISGVIGQFNYSLFYILISIFFSLGVILFVLGIMGMYIGRIMIESQDRPVYIVDEYIEKR